MRALYDVAAPAKLNLFLHVVGKRPDGYHLLQSVFVLIDWSDRLDFERRDDGVLRRHDLGPALPEDDLCLRAARTLKQHSGTPFGVDISIDKQVPWGAGMGGGSSDAASTLLALNRLWQLHWPRARLAELALTLGADVPFFIGGRNAFVEGIGEQLTPITLPSHRFAVLKPAVAINTAAIFRSPLLTRSESSAIVAGFIARHGENWATQRSFSDELMQGLGRNDLQTAAQAESGGSESQVLQAARLLEARFGNSRMTGSGSAVFARCDEVNEDLEQQAAAGAPRATMPTDLPSEWVGRMCRSLEQHPLVGWAAD